MPVCKFQRRPDHEPDTRIDKFTLGMVLVILLGICIPLIFYPEKGKLGWEWHVTFMTTNFGVTYLAFGVAMMFVISSSSLISVRSDLVALKTRPNLKTLHGQQCCSVAVLAPVFYWGLIEWAYYYQSPPFILKAAH